ncbi:MAG: hypothetical protein LBU36_08700 [Clostridiales bacterium]|jgi:dipicolinate synthase subunit A|nr:hypothetical protein [Clostridiales bacterium]
MEDLSALTAAVIGGDKRNIYLYKLLAERGAAVRCRGFDLYEAELINEARNLYEAVSGADIIIGGTPAADAGGALNMPFSSRTETADSLFRLIKPGQLFFGGFLREETIRLAEKYGVKYRDLLRREDLAILNAIPTAEGVARLCIENTDATLHEAKILVIGYGRCGKAICGIMRGFGADLRAAARGAEEAAAARLCGVRPVSLENEELARADIIINTAPARVITRRNAKHIRRSALIVDVSSAPHGVDYGAAKARGLNVIFTGSLPGSTAPKTTALYNLEGILRVIREQGQEQGGAEGD